MKNLACLLAVGAALASQVDFARAAEVNGHYVVTFSDLVISSSQSSGLYDVEVGTPTGQRGDPYVIVHGSRNADPGRLVAQRSNSVFTEDVDRDGFVDLVLLGAVVTPEDVDGDGVEEFVVSVGSGKPRADNVVFVMTTNPFIGNR